MLVVTPAIYFADPPLARSDPICNVDREVGREEACEAILESTREMKSFNNAKDR